MDSSHLPQDSFTSIPANAARQIGALCITSTLVPFLVLQSLVSVLTNGFGIWMASWLPDIAVGGVCGAIVAWALYHHSSWFFSFLLLVSRIVLAAYVLGFVFGVVTLAGLIPRTAHDLGFMNVVNVVEWVVFSPLACAVWFLMRSDYVRSRTTFGTSGG